MSVKNKNRLAVAMSGGVDSSMAAAFLKEEGYEIIGLTMHLWNPAQDEPGSFGRCCSWEDIRDARRVADALGFPHYVINLREAFEEEIVQYFVREYQRCRTPNPCLPCNERMKFRLLLRQAEKLGACGLATGHYARVVYDAGKNRYLLLRGLDRSKDQSYFLSSLNQEQLGRALFPLGGKTKEEVRREARRLGLRVAQKKESQEVCFIPDGDYRKFVESRVGREIGSPGDIVDRQGKVLGRHRGLYSYTIGQRRGLGLPGPKPHYVVALDPKENRLVAGGEEELLAGGLIASGMNWIAFAELKDPLEALVQIRYRHKGGPALISPLGKDRVRVDFRVPQKSITPGQAAVFYQGDEVLGGGWIERAL